MIKCDEDLIGKTFHDITHNLYGLIIDVDTVRQTFEYLVIGEKIMNEGILNMLTEHGMPVGDSIDVYNGGDDNSSGIVLRSNLIKSDYQEDGFIVLGGSSNLKYTRHSTTLSRLIKENDQDYLLFVGTMVLDFTVFSDFNFLFFDFTFSVIRDILRGNYNLMRNPKVISTTQTIN